MIARIIDRGRGPEVEGTRVTVYRIMDFVNDNCSADRISAELDLTDEQVRVALHYIHTHRQSVEIEYKKILQRVQQANPSEITAGKAKSADEMQQRIRMRQAQPLIHA